MNSLSVSLATYPPNPATNLRTTGSAQQSVSTHGTATTAIPRLAVKLCICILSEKPEGPMVRGEWNTKKLPENL